MNKTVIFTIVFSLFLTSCGNATNKGAKDYENDTTVYVISKLSIPKESMGLEVYKTPSTTSERLINDLESEGDGYWFKWGASPSEEEKVTFDVLPVLEEENDWYKVFVRCDWNEEKFIGFVPKGSCKEANVSDMTFKDLKYDLIDFDEIHLFYRDSVYVKWGFYEMLGNQLFIGKLKDGKAMETDEIFYNCYDGVVRVGTEKKNYEFSGKNYTRPALRATEEADFEKFSIEDFHKVISLSENSYPNTYFKVEGVSDFYKIKEGDSINGRKLIWNLTQKQSPPKESKVTRYPEESNSIPSSAKKAAENEEYILYINNEPDPNFDEEDPDPAGARKVSLWIHDKTTKKESRILVTNPEAEVDWWYRLEEATKVPKDYIRTISNVVILSTKGEPLKLLVDGNGPTAVASAQSFIIDLKTDKALCLPSNLGFHSKTGNKINMLSTWVYKEGGRFDSVETFDFNGKRISGTLGKSNPNELPDGNYLYEGCWESQSYDTQPCQIAFNKKGNKLSNCAYSNLFWNTTISLIGNIVNDQLEFVGKINGKNLVIKVQGDEKFNIMEGEGKDNAHNDTATLKLFNANI